MTEKALREGYQATPLGYRAVGEGKPFAVEEKSYAIVEYIFQTYHSGKDMTATARAANARGYRTRRGNLFDRRGINRILANRFYIGEVIWNGGIPSRAPTRYVPPSPPYLTMFRSGLKAIPAPETPGGFNNVHWLSGLLKCSICGGSLGWIIVPMTRRRGLTSSSAGSTQRGCIRVPAAGPYTLAEKSCD